jgi:hypothetical protein
MNNARRQSLTFCTRENGELQKSNAKSGCFYQSNSKPSHSQKTCHALPQVNQADVAHTSKVARAVERPGQQPKAKDADSSCLSVVGCQKSE